MREAIQRWAVKRGLNVTRAFLARNPTPARIRSATARFAPLVARRESCEVSVPFAVGEASAHWVQPNGVPADGVILYFHGGAFIASSNAWHGRWQLPATLPRFLACARPGSIANA